MADNIGLTASRHLLAMLATAPVEAAGPLCDVHWQAIERMAEQHRLLPLLHERLRDHATMEAEPTGWRARLAAAYRQSALDALLARAVLLRVSAILDAAGIAHAALKGADLAWHAYDHPALRPMRDLDVLVAPEQALAAWQVLLSDGFVRDESSTTPLDYAHAERKHLPGLVDPASGILIELHTRLFELQSTSNPNCRLLDSGHLLAGIKRRAMGTAKVAFLPSTETLLHMIAHATREHHFDNGPQVIEDIRMLLRRGDVDWPRFRALATEGGWERDCQLLFAIVEHFHGPQPVDWEEWWSVPVPPALVDDATAMMLQDFDERTDLTVQAQLASMDTAAGRMALLRRLFPRRHVLASYRGGADHWTAWLSYPGWLVSRLRRTLAGARDPVQRAQAARTVRIERWLAGT